MVKCEKLELRDAKEDDVDDVYKLQTHPASRKYFNEPTIPTYSEHVQWFHQSIKNPERHLYVIECDTKNSGLVRLDFMAEEPAVAEISILISPDYQGSGLGKQVVKCLQDMYEYITILATVHKDNIASQNLFRSCGFVQESETNFIFRPQK